MRVDDAQVDRLVGALDVSDALTDADLFTIAKTGQDGATIDSAAAGMAITSLGLERDGFRNGWLAINAGMANADESWAGIYVAQVPEPPMLMLAALALWAAGMQTRRRKA